MSWGPLVLAPAVKYLEVGGVGSKVDAGGSGIQPGVAIRPCRPVPGGAVGGRHFDLAGALELRGIRVPRALALPEVEDAGRIPALLRSLTPVAARQGAVLLPGLGRSRSGHRRGPGKMRKRPTAEGSFAPPNSPASNTTLSRGDAWPDYCGPTYPSSGSDDRVEHERCEIDLLGVSSTSRSRVDSPRVEPRCRQGSTSADVLEPARDRLESSFACLPDDPIKMRGLFSAIHDDGRGAHATVDAFGQAAGPRRDATARLAR